MPRSVLMGLLAIALLAPALAHAQSNDGRYDIMRPEPGRPQELPTPWLPPKYQSPRGLPQHVKPVKPMRVPRVDSAPPPPIVNPQTGVALPNMPIVSPSGPGGRETYQDRAARCAHQAGAYGANAGDRGTYIGTCINQ